MDKNVHQPSLSVVVVVLHGQKTLAICLQSLSYQANAVPVEIIVPYDDRFTEILTLQHHFPNIRFYHLAGFCTYAELRAFGLKQATGAILAITEDHCIPAKDWLEQILRAHEREYAAVGGAVEKITPDTAVNLAVYFADYLRYMPPLPEGATHSLTDLNVSYKREALLEINEVWEKEFHENAVNAALAERGLILWLSPKVLVHQSRNFTPREALRDRYAFGRLFASTRVAMSAPAKRLVYLAASIALPFLLTGRILAHFARKRRLVIEFVRALPYVVLLSLSWAWGEFLGYLTGKAEASLTARP